jgi:hypothetical protein
MCTDWEGGLKKRMEGCGRMRFACIKKHQHEAKMRQPCPCKVLLLYNTATQEASAPGVKERLCSYRRYQGRIGHDRAGQGSTEQYRT